MKHLERRDPQIKADTRDAARLPYTIRASGCAVGGKSLAAAAAVCLCASATAQGR